MLELGGKSPNIVFADANLDAAEAGVLAGIFSASGQMCTAGSRLFVESSIAAEFVERLVGRARAIRLGDPTDPATEMGPIASAAHREKIEGMVQDAERGEEPRLRVAAGGLAARVSTSGTSSSRPS